MASGNMSHKVSLDFKDHLFSFLSSLSGRLGIRAVVLRTGVQEHGPLKTQA